MGLVKSLQQSASETALCVDIRLAAAILTNLLSKQAVCLLPRQHRVGANMYKFQEPL